MIAGLRFQEQGKHPSGKLNREKDIPATLRTPSSINILINSHPRITNLTPIHRQREPAVCLVPSLNPKHAEPVGVERILRQHMTFCSRYYTSALSKTFCELSVSSFTTYSPSWGRCRMISRSEYSGRILVLRTRPEGKQRYACATPHQSDPARISENGF